MVSAATGIAEVAAALAAAPLVAFDLEFDSRETRIPVLCLVQVAWVTAIPDTGWDAPDAARVTTICVTPPQIALLDPLVPGCDLAPVMAALAAHPRVLAHAPRQDLGIIAARYGAACAAMPGLVDTQLMAALAGLGEQLGLGALAGDLLGVTLDKEQQFTAWQQRPLTDAQLAYAAADVRYLPALYATLAQRLGPRLAWARAETAVIAADAIAAQTPDLAEAWRDVSGLRGFDAQAMGEVAALAAWRVRESIALDRPVGQVLSDKAVVEIVRGGARDAEAIGAVRGVSTLAKARADELAVVLAGAVPLPIGRARAASPRAQRWTDVLLAIAQLVAEQAGLATRLLATRADAERFARTVDEQGLGAAAELPALATWRRELLGVAWEGFMTGRLALVGDVGGPAGILLSPK